MQLISEFGKSASHLKGRERFLALLDLLAKAYPKSYGRNRDALIAAFDKEFNHQEIVQLFLVADDVYEYSYSSHGGWYDSGGGYPRFYLRYPPRACDIPSYETIKDEWEKHTLVYNSVKNGQLIFKVIPDLIRVDERGRLMVPTPQYLSYGTTEYVIYQIYSLNPDRVEAVVER